MFLISSIKLSNSYFVQQILLEFITNVTRITNTGVPLVSAPSPVSSVVGLLKIFPLSKVTREQSTGKSSIQYPTTSIVNCVTILGTVERILIHTKPLCTTQVNRWRNSTEINVTSPQSIGPVLELISSIQ